MLKKNLALAGTAVAVLSSFSGAAMAQAVNYGSLAADGVGEIQGYFDSVYSAAIPVMLTIVGAMVAWKYGKKLFSKV